jgi:hypothetical protein
MKSYPPGYAPLDLPIPAPRTPQGRYYDLISAVIEEGGEWLAVSRRVVAGKTNGRKSTAVLAAAVARGIKVQTRHDGNHMYVRLVVPGADHQA